MAEMIEIINEKGQIVKIVSSGEMRKKNLLHRGTFVFVLNSRGKMLITRRSETKYISPGLYEITHGGVVDVGEKPEDNAIKELKEELGIRKSRLKFLFNFRFKDAKNNVIGSAYRCVWNGPIKLQRAEVVSYEWVLIEELEKRIRVVERNFHPPCLAAFRKWYGKK
jgi:isopentenyldiphosphate isomerase